MKPSIYLALILCLSIFAQSCKDEEKDESKIKITGFTQRDDNGNLNGTSDGTDWQLTDSFNADENALFPGDNLAVCPDSTLGLVAMAFPNPCMGFFTFQTQSADNPRVALRLVDENLKVLFSKDSVYSKSLLIQEEADGGSRSLRLYYRIYYDNCKLQGHGDIAFY